MKQKKSGKLQREHGRLSWMISLVCVLLLIGLNAAMYLIDTRFGLQLDLSEEKKYQVSDISAEALAQLEEPVSITMLAGETAMETGNAYTSLVYYLLRQYPRRFPQISLSFVDLVESPAFASQYPQYDLKTYDTIISCGEKSRQININDMFSYETNGYSSQVRGSVAEQTITNAILAVSSSRQLKVVCLEGFSGSSPDALLSLYEDSGAQVTRASLITEDIRADVQTAILFDLQRDPDEASLAKLDRWLSNGGANGKTLLVFSNPYHHLLPAFNDFLADWNLRTEDGLIVETTAGRYYSVPYCPVAQTVSPELLAETDTSKIPAAFMLCCPVSGVNAADDQHLTEVLLSFSENAAVLPLDAKSEDDAVPSASPVGILRSSSIPSAATGAVSSIVLTGSCEAVSSQILGGSTFSNSILFKNLSGGGVLAPSVRIPEKNMAQAAVSMPHSVVVLCIVLFLAVIPLIILVLGIVIWMRRRHG